MRLLRSPSCFLHFLFTFIFSRARKRPGWKSKSKVKISIFQARWRRRDECDIFLLELLSSQFCNLLLCSFISHLLAELHTRITLYTSRKSDWQYRAIIKTSSSCSPHHTTPAARSRHRHMWPWSWTLPEPQRQPTRRVSHAPHTRALSVYRPFFRVISNEHVIAGMLMIALKRRVPQRTTSEQLEMKVNTWQRRWRLSSFHSRFHRISEMWMENIL